MTGEDVLRVAVTAAREVLGADLAAAFALGSLAHGGFAPLVSDVDVALVVAEGTTARRVAGVAELVHARTADPLARRLSVFWSDWAGVRRGGGAGRLPAVDRLDLLESGRLLYGADERDGAVPPSARLLVRESAEFAVARFDAAYRERLLAPELLLADGVRATTKAVLFPVRFGYTLATGRLGHNDDAAAWYRGPARPLVDAAAHWRHHDLGDHDDRAAAHRLLTAHLTGLYRDFLTAHAAAVPDLALPLTTLRAALS